MIFSSLIKDLGNWLKNRFFSKTFYFSFTGYSQVQIIIKRIDATDHGIFGQLTCGGFTCVTLERHDIAIPTGTYPVTLYNSPDHNGLLVPLLHNVPGRDFIEIHCGNWESDSKGCILVGVDRDGFAVDASHDAFEDLMNVLKGQSNIEVVIT